MSNVGEQQRRSKKKTIQQKHVITNAGEGPTSHGVEEHLLGGQAPEVAVLHEPAALRPVVVLREVRETAPPEPERDPLPLHVLLPHAGRDLRMWGPGGGWQYEEKL